MHALLLLPLLLPALAPSDPQGGRSPEEILKEIRSSGSDSPPALFEELAKQRSAEALEALIEGLQAVAKPDKVCAGFKAFRHFQGVDGVADDAARYLAERADSKPPKLGLHAVWNLGSLWPAGRDELVELALDHPTPDGRSFALMHLVEHELPLTDKELGRFARSKDDAVRYEVLLASTGRIEDPERRARAIEKGLGSRDAIERLAAVELLGALEHPGRFERLAERLGDEDPRVRRKALHSLERTRSREAVERLIVRLDVAGESERFRLSRTLVRLTGRDLGREPGRWQRWWAAEGATFEVGALGDGDEAAPPAGPGVNDEGSTRSDFYGLPIHAERLVFAIDASDSMKKAAKGDDGPSRIEIAKQQLLGAIERLEEPASFDVVHFGASAWSWKGELTPASERNKKAALKHVRYLDLSWGTEVYGALREAFRDPRADTVLLLTDGDPQLSLMQDRAAVQRIVAQWNRTRHTAIDCLSIGAERAWLRKLADQTGGRYKTVD